MTRPPAPSAPTGTRPRAHLRRGLAALGLLTLPAAAVAFGDTTAQVIASLVVSVVGLALLHSARPHHGAADASPADSSGPDSFDVDLLLLDDAEVDHRLHRLRDDSVEQLNLALAEGRTDLADEVSDDYFDRALALMTASYREPHPA